MILFDTNVLLDIATADPVWLPWSENEFRLAAAQGPVGINPIIYAEVSIRFERIEELETALGPRFFAKLDLPWEAAFLAGKCFLKYRRTTGSRRSPLPDFYIGAHAAVLKTPLITRDKGRYESYFPTLKIIAP